MHKPNLGKQATRSQQLLLRALVTPRSWREQIVIHHVTDTPFRLQLEIERRCPINGIKFERIIL
jgi:hypothetical protein